MKSAAPFARLCPNDARAGVEVRVLLDGVGSGWSLNNSDVRMMETRRLQVHLLSSDAFVASGPDQSAQSPAASLVVDGRIGFTGGVGFAKQWSGHAQDTQHWRDVQLQRPRTVGGKIAISFPGTLGENERRGIERRRSIPGLTAAEISKAQIVSSHSFSIAPIPLVQAVAFAAANKRIWITNAYCTPTSDQVELLTKAARRGVDVRILVPGQNNDQPLTKSAGRGAYGKLLEGGVKIFEYEPTMIHIKSIVADTQFSMIGSSNLDARSAEINEELDVVVIDRDFGRRMEETFTRDLSQSREYTLSNSGVARSGSEQWNGWLTLPLANVSGGVSISAFSRTPGRLIFAAVNLPFDLIALREEYFTKGLRRIDLDPDPIKEFGIWFTAAVEVGISEMNAMALATVAENGQPTTRMVLLKGYDHDGFVFYTNYLSEKGRHLEKIRGRLWSFTGRNWSDKSGSTASPKSFARRIGPLFPFAPARQPARGVGFAPERCDRRTPNLGSAALGIRRAICRPGNSPVHPTGAVIG